MEMFKVGDRVQLVNFTETFTGLKNGDTGVIKGYRGDGVYDYAVEMDNPFENHSHDCEGLTLNDRGRYFKQCELQVLSESVMKENQRTSTLSELLDRVKELEIELEKAKKELKDRL